MIGYSVSKWPAQVFVLRFLLWRGIRNLEGWPLNVYSFPSSKLYVKKLKCCIVLSYVVCTIVKNPAFPFNQLMINWCVYLSMKKQKIIHSIEAIGRIEVVMPSEHKLRCIAIVNWLYRHQSVTDRKPHLVFWHLWT